MPPVTLVFAAELITCHGLIEREFFVDNLLVRIQLIIEMILADRPSAMGVSVPSSR